MLTSTARLLSALPLLLGLALPAHAALTVGAPAPDFSADAAVGGQPFKFKLAEALKQGPVVVYFYPKAFTSGCTVEAHQFAEATDKFKTLNTTVIGDWDSPRVRLPGSGGAADIMANAGEVFVVLRRHDPAAFPAELDFVTSASPVRAAEQPDFIQPRGFGVSTVITPLGILRRRERLGELELSEVHPGVTVEQVQEATGWDLAVAEDVTQTQAPTAEEVRLLRDEIDTVRLYLR